MAPQPLQSHPQHLGASAPQVPADEHVLLIGRPPLTEFLGFIEGQTVDGAATDRRELMDRWRAANDHIRQLELYESGWADDSPVTPLPEALADRAAGLLSDPIVMSAHSVVPTEVALVELDRLVVFQKMINLGYAEQLRDLLPKDASAEDVFDFALPTDRRYDPPIQTGVLGHNAWGFTSVSKDLRALDVQVIDPRSIAGLSAGGSPAAVLAVVVGYGPNLLTAYRAGDRLVLKNGSHRAYALRAAGHDRVPCLIENMSRPEELELLGSDEVQQRPELYLQAPRPPVLKDFFDDRLRMTAQVPRTRRQVQAVVKLQVVPA